MCITFDQMIISCMSGICKNVSEVYDCNYKSKLDDLYDEQGGRGSARINRENVFNFVNGTISDFATALTALRL